MVQRKGGIVRRPLGRRRSCRLVTHGARRRFRSCTVQAPLALGPPLHIHAQGQPEAAVGAVADEDQVAREVAAGVCQGHQGEVALRRALQATLLSGGEHRSTAAHRCGGASCAALTLMTDTAPTLANLHKATAQTAAK